MRQCRHAHRRLQAIHLLIYFCVQLFAPSFALAEESGSGADILGGTGSTAASISSAVSSDSSSSSSGDTGDAIPLDDGIPSLRIVINEVMWMGSDVSTADEWVEVAASGSGSGRADIGGWRLTIEKTTGESTIATFPIGSSIGSGEYLVISNYDRDHSRLLNDSFFVSTSLSLPNTKLLLRLRDASGALIDEVDDGVGIPFAGSNPAQNGPKASMERVDASVAGNIASNWRTATASRGFDEGSPIYGTPGLGNAAIEQQLPPDPLPQEGREESSASMSSSSSSHPSSSLRLTELLPNPVGSDSAEWLEMKNTGSGAASLSGLSLKVGSTTHVLRLDRIIQAGDITVLTKDDVTFTLANAGNTVSLEDHGVVIDAVTYPKLPDGVSFGRNAVGEWQAFCVPTQGEDNAPILPNPFIVVQSGNLQTTTPVTLNLSTAVQTGSLTSSTCHYDFGDGYTSDSCNPPSHTMRSAGPFTVRLTYVDYCSNTVERSIEGNVVPKPFSTQKKSVEKKTMTKQEFLGCVPSAASGVVINEVLPNPSSEEKDGEWVELFNPTSSPISLCGWSIDDEEGGSRPYNLSSYQLPPQSYLVLPRIDTAIALNNDHDQVRLIAPLQTSGTGVIATVQIDNAPEDQSFALNERGVYEWTPQLTLGSVNAFASSHSAFEPSFISISAALPNPLGDDTYGEWIELQNDAGYPIWLNGWQIAEDTGKHIEIQGFVLAKKQKKKFSLEGRGMRLKNTNGSLTLIDEQGIIRSIFVWEKAGEDQVVRRPELRTHEVVTLQSIVDGDTITILDANSIPQTVRLIGIDTMELHDQNSKKLSYALKAKEFMKALTKNKKIELQFDTKKSDKYGRLLAYVSADGEDVGRALLTSGLAYAYRVFSHTKDDEYIAYEGVARSAHTGFWTDEQLTEDLTAREMRQQHFHDAQEQGLTLRFNSNTNIIQKNQQLDLLTSLPSHIFLSSDGHQFHPFTGSLIIANNATFYAYAETGLDEASGTIVRSPIEKRTFVIDEGSYPLSVFISEVYASPAEGDTEWVELWNSSDSAVSLAGWQLDDKKDAGSKPWIGDTGAVIPAHGYIVLPSSVTHLILNNSGDDVRLLSPDGRTVDAVTYPKIKTGYAYARDVAAQSFCVTSTVTPSQLNKCGTQKKVLQKVVKSKYIPKKGTKKLSFKTSKTGVAGTGVYAALRAQVTPAESASIQLILPAIDKSGRALALLTAILLVSVAAIAFYIEKIRKK